MALWPQGRRGHTPPGRADTPSRPSVAVTDGQKTARLAHLGKRNTQIYADCSHGDEVAGDIRREGVGGAAEDMRG